MIRHDDDFKPVGKVKCVTLASGAARRGATGEGTEQATTSSRVFGT